MRVRLQRLPTGYREVEYLESTGTQYINTGVNASSSLGLHYRIIDKSGRFGVLGADDNKRHHSYDSSALYGYYSSRYGSSGFVNVDMTIKVNWLNDKKLDLHTSNYENTWNLSTTTFDTSMTYILFARGYRSQGTINPYWSGRIYYFKMSVGTEIVRNFIPCIRTSDNKPGLYDTINSTFYTNQGTGEFLYGPYHDSYKLPIYPRLPNAYQEVEYIGMSGAQQINTGMKFDMQNGACEITFQASTTNQNGMLIASTNSNYFWLYYYNSSNKINLYVNASGQKVIQGNAVDLNKHTIEYKNKHMYIDGVDKGSFSVTLSETTGNVYIGSYGGNYFFQGKIFDCKIWDGNYKLVRNFIPCYRKSDNVIGLFDIVNQQFYTNQGTGTFTKGSNVNYIQNCLPKITLVPSAYQEVEYITATGTQYINTNYKITSENVKIDFKCSISNSTNAVSLFGSNDSSSKYDLVPYVSSGYGTRTFKHWVGTSGGILATSYADGANSVIYTMQNNTITAKVNGNTTSTSFSGSIITGENFYIFGKNNHGSSAERGNGYTLYYLKLYDNDVLVRNLIPCYRKSDSVVGMLDTIQGKFYTNAGTGTFTKGSNKYTII